MPSRSFNSAALKDLHIQEPLWPQTKSAIDVEIGCGVGWHPLRYAQLHPERYLIAIERTRAKFLKFQRRYENHQCPTNLLPVHGDAIGWLTRRAPPQSISKVFIHYPNPYPKEAHRMRRWAYSLFWECFLDKLKPGCQLTFATNLSWYAQELSESLPTNWNLKLLQSGRVQPEAFPRTHFEKKYLASGQVCHNLIFQK